MGWQRQRRAPGIGWRSLQGRASRSATATRRSITFIQEYIDQRVVRRGRYAGAGPVVAGDVPQPPEAFQPRAGLLAAAAAAAGRGWRWSAR